VEENKMKFKVQIIETVTVLAIIEAKNSKEAMAKADIGDYTVQADAVKNVIDFMALQATPYKGDK
jgi:hypothetical protein